MKKLISTFMLTLGLITTSGMIEQVNACYGSYSEEFYRGSKNQHCRKDLLNLMTIAQECDLLAKPKIRTVKPKARAVNFFVLGQKNINNTAGTFENLTTPGQGLLLKYKPKAGGTMQSIILTTDPERNMDQVSPDSRYPVWGAQALLKDGKYTGQLFFDRFEESAPNGSPILSVDFTVGKKSSAFMIIPRT